MIGCSELAVGEDKADKESEADDAVASSMQDDAASRSRSKDNRYRQT